MNEIEKTKPISESEAIIKNSENFVGMGLWNIGNELKYIRDNKTYEEKGYFSFEEYAGMELDYTKRHAYRYIEIAENYTVTSMSQIGHLGITKLIALGQLEETERTNFFENNNVENMSTRELQQAIKRNKELEKQIEELKNQEPKTVEKVIEKEIVPNDYNKLKRDSIEKQSVIDRLKSEKELLEKKVALNKQEADRYNNLKNQIKVLSQEKNDLNRQINAATELSGLVVEVKHYFTKNFAPIKYSRAITEASKDRIVKENLKEILNTFQDWIDEMTQYITDDEIEVIDVEVIE